MNKRVYKLSYTKTQVPYLNLFLIVFASYIVCYLYEKMPTSHTVINSPTVTLFKRKYWIYYAIKQSLWNIQKPKHTTNLIQAIVFYSTCLIDSQSLFHTILFEHRIIYFNRIQFSWSRYPLNIPYFHFCKRKPTFKCLMTIRNWYISTLKSEYTQNSATILLNPAYTHTWVMILI